MKHRQRHSAALTAGGHTHSSRQPGHTSGGGSKKPKRNLLDQFVDKLAKKSDLTDYQIRELRNLIDRDRAAVRKAAQKPYRPRTYRTSDGLDRKPRT